MYLVQKYIKKTELWKDVKVFDDEHFSDAFALVLSRLKSSDYEKEGKASSCLFIGSSGKIGWEFRIVNMLAK